MPGIAGLNNSGSLMSYCQCRTCSFAYRSIVVRSKRYERLALSATCKNLQADSNGGRGARIEIQIRNIEE